MLAFLLCDPSWCAQKVRTGAQTRWVGTIHTKLQIPWQRSNQMVMQQESATATREIPTFRGMGQGCRVKPFQSTDPIITDLDCVVSLKSRVWKVNVSWVDEVVETTVSASRTKCTTETRR